MDRAKKLLQAQLEAEQFQLFVTLESLERLPDEVVAKLPRMPFREFCELIEVLMEADAARQYQRPKAEPIPKQRKGGRWPWNVVRRIRIPRRGKHRLITASKP